MALSTGDFLNRIGPQETDCSGPVDPHTLQSMYEPSVVTAALTHNPANDLDATSAAIDAAIEHLFQ